MSSSSLASRAASRARRFAFSAGSSTPLSAASAFVSLIQNPTAASAAAERRASASPANARTVLVVAGVFSTAALASLSSAPSARSASSMSDTRRTAASDSATDVSFWSLDCADARSSHTASDARLHLADACPHSCAKDQSSSAAARASASDAFGLAFLARRRTSSRTSRGSRANAESAMSRTRHACNTRRANRVVSAVNASADGAIAVAKNESGSASERMSAPNPVRFATRPNPNAIAAAVGSVGGRAVGTRRDAAEA